jgi:hypothetical protein
MKNQESNPKVPANMGGLVVQWLLADDPSSFTTKAGEVRTVIELRDPTRLGKSLVIWLEGDSQSFKNVPPGSYISLRLESVRSGKGRGELIADVSREAVETAFQSARSSS